jgi:hypothetical protein
MIYHLDETMEKNIKDELAFKNIKVNINEPFIYNGFKIDMVNKTIECLNPIKNIIVIK